MGSLQDQMLKAGLVSEEKVKKAEKDAARARRKAGKPKKSKRKPASGRPAPSKAQRDKREHDRKLNRAVNAERDRKSRLASLRDVLAKKRLNDPDGDVKHYYQSGRKIKYVYITGKQKDALAAGKLVIAVLEGRGHLVDKATEKSLLALDPEGLDIRIGTASSAEDDPAYEDHPIPDDLMW